MKMNIVSLCIQCIEDNLASITTATAAEEDLQQLKRMTNDLDKFLESHQTAALFEFRLLVGKRVSVIRSKLVFFR